MLIEVLGSFGAGKTSLVHILSKEFNLTPYIEDPEKIPVLKDFYDKGTGAFTVQIAYLNYRYKQLKKAVHDDKAIIDGSIIADTVVCKVLYDRGEISEAKYNVYLDLVNSLLNDSAGSINGPYPDLFIFLKIGKEHEIENIFSRGRAMEQDPKHIEYFNNINEGFKNWEKGFTQAHKLVIDMDKYDYVNNEEDKNKVIEIVKNKLKELGV